ncbi:MAG: type I 3-dehydroquinate dehydratase [Motiliproteus sp.]|nr:type I 3-dehydroquinate dehydratase [Motiliproteus sp.]MCW9053005.1 type I 3-dehydroquinate dehydratase [Motiliproteus sp.]
MLTIGDKTFGKENQPLICTPLVASSREALLQELKVIVEKQPDLIEWRVDFFDQIAEADQVVAMAEALKLGAQGIPLLFTRRAEHEGGEIINMAEADVVALYQQVCASGHIDLIDYELSNDSGYLEQIKNSAETHDIPLIISYHNFQQTPTEQEIVHRLLHAEQAGAAIAKVAVMPNSKRDVLTLLSATEKAAEQLDIPVITMSMGAFGSLSRMFGGAFGSAVTFAVGQTSSAPGQMAIEDLRSVLEIVGDQLS